MLFNPSLRRANIGGTMRAISSASPGLPSHRQGARITAWASTSPRRRAATTPAPARRSCSPRAWPPAPPITMEMYAERKGWDIGDARGRLRVHPGRARVPDALLARAALPARPERRAGRRSCKIIAAKCPVHRTLDGEVMFDERVERRGPGLRLSARDDLARALRARPARSRRGDRPRRPRPHRRRRARPAVPATTASLHAVLTRRRDDMRRHAGEVAFPGGRQDPARTCGSRRCARPRRRSGCRATTSSCSARCSRRRRSRPTTRSTPSSGSIEPGQGVGAVPARGRGGHRAVADRRCAAATAGSASCAAASRCAATSTSWATHSSGARRPGCSPTCWSAWARSPCPADGSTREALTASPPAGATSCQRPRRPDRRARSTPRRSS